MPPRRPPYRLRCMLHRSWQTAAAARAHCPPTWRRSTAAAASMLQLRARPPLSATRTVGNTTGASHDRQQNMKEAVPDIQEVEVSDTDPTACPSSKPSSTRIMSSRHRFCTSGLESAPGRLSARLTWLLGVATDMAARGLGGGLGPRWLLRGLACGDGAGLGVREPRGDACEQSINGVRKLAVVPGMNSSAAQLRSLLLPGRLIPWNQCKPVDPGGAVGTTTT